MASDELDSETLHEDTAEEDKGQEVQQLRTELESYKSQMEDQNSMIMDMEEQLSLLREENKSLKQTVLTVSQEKEQQELNTLQLAIDNAETDEERAEAKKALADYERIDVTTLRDELTDQMWAEAQNKRTQPKAVRHRHRHPDRQGRSL